MVGVGGLTKSPGAILDARSAARRAEGRMPESIHGVDSFKELQSRSSVG